MNDTLPFWVIFVCLLVRPKQVREKPSFSFPSRNTVSVNIGG